MNVWRAFWPIGAGALAGLSQMPTGWPVAFIAATMLALRRIPQTESVFWYGWRFGLGFYTVSLYWISTALLVDGWRYIWLLPAAAVGIPALLALGSGLAFKACTCGPTPFSRAMLFSGVWLLAEGARSHGPLPFPWALVGYGWGEWLSFLQISHYIGVYGLGAILLLLTCGIGFSARLLGGTIALSIGLAALWGHQRLTTTPTVFSPHTLRLVQPNIRQQDKWHPQKSVQHFEQLLVQSHTPTDTALSAIIWPESAVAWPVADSPATLSAIRALGAPVILGNTRILDATRLANSLLVIGDPQTNPVYDKRHLVPFGEYIPLSRLLPWKSLTGASRQFVSGISDASLTTTALPPFQPLICYEVIFPTPATNAAWLVNITNDAWFGYSSGPYQHWYMARLRAIITGLPLVRVANTGISGVIDPVGRVIAKIPLGEQAVVDVRLPEPLGQ